MFFSLNEKPNIYITLLIHEPLTLLWYRITWIRFGNTRTVMSLLLLAKLPFRNHTKTSTISVMHPSSHITLSVRSHCSYTEYWHNPQARTTPPPPHLPHPARPLTRISANSKFIGRNFLIIEMPFLPEMTALGNHQAGVATSTFLTFLLLSFLVFAFHFYWLHFCPFYFCFCLLFLAFIHSHFPSTPPFSLSLSFLVLYCTFVNSRRW